MQYIGLQTQIWRNNFKSTLLLIAFPSLMLLLSWLFFFFINNANTQNITKINQDFLYTFPWITGIVLIWFIIAYNSHTILIRNATGAKPLSRKDNKKIYNLVENLCISQGMQMPKINVIDDNSLNAFASGINEKTYTITLSIGIIKKLTVEELETVIAHELTHIQNKDVRLLIISIIFVGIFAFVSEIAFRSIGRGNNRNNKKAGQAIIVVAILAIIGYALSVVFKFTLSRKREYLADAGSAQMTHHPEALASALQKISQDPQIEAVKRKDVAQMFIENPQSKKKSLITSLFATHPPIEDRINVLKQF